MKSYRNTLNITIAVFLRKCFELCTSQYVRSVFAGLWNIVRTLRLLFQTTGILTGVFTSATKNSTKLNRS